MPCATRGGWSFVTPPAWAPTPGLPDLQAIKDGRVVMVEVKTPKGRLSDAQAAFSRAWQLAGGEYVVARSVDDVAALVDCLPLSCAAMPARR